MPLSPYLGVFKCQLLDVLALLMITTFTLTLNHTFCVSVSIPLLSFCSLTYKADFSFCAVQSKKMPVQCDVVKTLTKLLLMGISRSMSFGRGTEQTF